MATSPIPQTIEILSREKNIDPQIIITAIEDAVVTAARKQFKTTEDLRARYNPENGDVELFALMTVVDEVNDPSLEISLADVEAMGVEGAEVGDQLEFPKPREELGRIAAQTAKQIIFQKVREAERNNVYDEYIDRIGELIHGFVKRFEGGRIIVDLGKIEAVLPKMQQSRAEGFSQGERIRIVINSVSKETKGPQVEVSRTSPELLKRLFEMEVPEIYDGTVQMKAAVREPGDRAKIAVISTERDVDPVGACVGMKGSRVQAIIRELRGERIDIIEWSEDPAVFAANALSPAKVSKVEINSFEEKKLTVTVPEDQLSLAIGKKGQNVRLAAKLVAWHIDIRSAEEAARAAAAQLEAVMAGGEATLTDIRESLALDQITAERLKDRGIETIEQLVPITLDELVEAIDVSFDQANDILERANRLLAQKHAREAQVTHEAESDEAQQEETPQEAIAEEKAEQEETPQELISQEEGEEATIQTATEAEETLQEGTIQEAVSKDEAAQETASPATAEGETGQEQGEAEDYITTPLEMPEEVAQSEPEAAAEATEEVSTPAVEEAPDETVPPPAVASGVEESEEEVTGETTEEASSEKEVAASFELPGDDSAEADLSPGASEAVEEATGPEETGESASGAPDDEDREDVSDGGEDER